jgi:NADH-quinone oxidoreductase subunit C
MLNDLIGRLAAKFSMETVRESRPDQYYVTVKKEELLSLMTVLKENEGFSHLVLLTAVDYIEQGVFQLTYLVNNPVIRADLGLRVVLDRSNPVMESIHRLWITAATYQRELREMFGIDFPGSPRVEEPFILEGWTNIPPYRRDFDTKKYAEETFFPRPGRETRNPADYMREKLYPGE